MSLAYLLIFLVEGKTSWVEKGIGKRNVFETVGKAKREKGPKDLCLNESKGLLPFVKLAFSYVYSDQPDYSKLKFLLISALMDNDQHPSMSFDWSQDQFSTTIEEN